MANRLNSSLASLFVAHPRILSLRRGNLAVSGDRVQQLDRQMHRFHTIRIVRHELPANGLEQGLLLSAACAKLKRSALLETPGRKPTLFVMHQHMK